MNDDDDASPLRFLANLREELAWVTGAACSGMDQDLFFPERGASVEPARAVCRNCPVREPCLEYALDNGEKFGIWGGMSERERRRERRKRRDPVRRCRWCGDPFQPQDHREGYCSDVCRDFANASKRESHRRRQGAA